MYQTANEVSICMTHRSTVKEASSFKQLIASTSGRAKHSHRMSIQLQQQDLLTFSKAMESTFSKDHKAFDSFTKKKVSDDLELVRSSSTPKMITIKSLKSGRKTDNGSKM
jgi:hypothetical protein